MLGIFYLACVHYLEPNQVGIVRNRFTGEVRLDDQASFDITPPWIAVSRIDIRPMRVCITSASRGFNCKLIQFAPAHFKEFVLVQGFHYYWWANRISFNFGYNEEYRGMKDLLRGYAYGTKQYPFVKILRDYKEEE
ncbi:hypothetical protein HYT01_00755 [Candidatus Giovannonibacteria bacterium]|nr:hypothetical protein [Candidatus Giovannonibacteria bacterium]